MNSANISLMSVEDPTPRIFLRSQRLSNKRKTIALSLYIALAISIIESEIISKNNYFLWYNPTSCACAFIFHLIDSSNLSLENQEVRSRFSDNAYTLNIYLCVQLDGQGAHRANSPREFCPNTEVSKLSWERTI